MGRANSQKRAPSLQRERELAFWKRERPTRYQAPPPTLPNVDVHGILFAIVAVVFVVYPLAQRALGL